MSETSSLTKLFEPGFIGTIKVKNRLSMAATGTNRATEDGRVSESMKSLYEARAKGGLGLVVVEVTCIDSPWGKRIARQLLIDDDKYVPGLSELSEVIKKHGARAAIQLSHAGNASHSWASGVSQPVGPSSIVRHPYSQARELSVPEIKRIIESFAKGAERAKRAGFDAVEIHAGHDYLIAEFLSPSFNKRQDEYGGSLENRCRLLQEVIRACKEDTGSDYPVWCRINGAEYGIDGGITQNEARQIAALAEQGGSDAISVSAIGFGGKYFLSGLPDKPGALVPLAANVKKVVNVPVIAVGRLDPKVGELALKEGKADFVTLSRAVICDSEFANKARGGKLGDIMPCIACYHCIRFTLPDSKVKPTDTSECTVNPAYGREDELRITPAASAKRVLVVGGGPAGMEAARVAALRGHKVTLCEKSATLGGQLRLASKPKYWNRYGLLNRFLIRQLCKLGVAVELDKKVTPDLVQTISPDAVIVATGCRDLVPDIPGIDRANVIQAIDALDRPELLGHKIVVIGGEKVGMRTAQFLAEQGKQVTIVTHDERVARGFQALLRAVLIDFLKEKGVQILTGVSCREISDKGLAISDQAGEKQVLEADTVVLAAGSLPDDCLYEALRPKVMELYQVGDCVRPRDLMEAMREGYRAGFQV